MGFAFRSSPRDGFVEKKRASHAHHENGGGGDGVRGLQARKCKSRSIDISKTASNTLLGVLCLVWLE